MLDGFLNLFRTEPRASERRAQIERRAAPIRGRYDAAQFDDRNRRHWLEADALGPNAANRRQVRQVLRNRARYETGNNTYARGLVKSLANDTIGRGPRLKLKTGNPEADLEISRKFFAWSKQVRLAKKLRTMRKARAVDGEAFALFVTNNRLKSEIKLDLRLIETDRVGDPTGELAVKSQIGGEFYDVIDGITYDEIGNPLTYRVMKQHPGEFFSLRNTLGYDDQPAEKVIHWYRPDRPEQLRGVPEISAALPLFAQLRRFTLATIAAAETAASFAGILKSDAPAGEDGDGVETWAAVELEHNALTAVPGGMSLEQMKAEHPTTTYPQFKQEILGEIARVEDMPYNVIAGNSAGFNFASARVDHQVYFRSIRVDQGDCEIEVLDRIFAEWLDEAVHVKDFLPRGLDPFFKWEIGWIWATRWEIDPIREATARNIDLGNGSETLEGVWAAKGEEWKPNIEQRGLEVATMREQGIPIYSPSGKEANPAEPDPDALDNEDALENATT